MGSAADTIYALSSGRTPSGVAVIRVSGPGARFALETISGIVPEARRLMRQTLRRQDGSALDDALVAWFPAPSSFTGEDVAELHCHGGRAVVAAIFAELGSLAGLRLAEAGEFSRRAFLNGKCDLAEAEAVADLIDAETEAQRRLAVDGLSGRQADLYAAWRMRLVEARALVEAEIDFSDEEDVGAGQADTLARVCVEIDTVWRDMLDHADGFRRAEIIRDGFRVVLAGAPNSGKSSLLNALARRNVAIVSEEPGTTRDVLDVSLDLEGQKVIVSDTAGLRADPGRIERLGIERAAGRIESANLVLHLVEPHGDVANLPVSDAKVWLVGTKTDLGASGVGSAEMHHSISAHTGEGIAVLLKQIADAAAEAVYADGAVLPARMRHVDLILAAAGHLASALGMGDRLELVAEELRASSDDLGRIAGQVDAEDLLDVIFSRFCIGK